MYTTCALYFYNKIHLTSPGDYPLSKLNAVGFCIRKCTKLPIEISLDLVS